LRSLANHGRDYVYIPGYTSPPLSEELLLRRFKFNRLGYSARGTEFEAALGLAQLADLEKRVGTRRYIADKMTQALEDFTGDLLLPREDCRKNHTWMMYPIVLSETSKLDRWQLCLHLEKAGIETRPMMPITNQPCYGFLLKPLRDSQHSWPVADRVNAAGFYIPCHEKMTEADVEHVKTAFKTFLSSNAVDRLRIAC
jgi:dTDP-4-amino-4,6-dideoxygalactose transaminase